MIDKAWSKTVLRFSVYILALLLAVYGLLHSLASDEFDYQHLQGVLKDFLAACWAVLHPIKTALTKTFSKPYFYICVSLILAWQFLKPAKTQKLFSVALAQDFAWFVASILVATFFFRPYWNGLKDIFDAYLGFLRVDAVTSWPLPAQAVTAIIVSDFLYWLQHYIKHKVPLFWQFHAVHHSQQEMNLFTDNRVHPLELLFDGALRWLPFFSLQVEIALPSALAWKIFSEWYTKLYHANIKSNFGIFKYIMVTPQSHRIHHSIEPQHRDKNFGSILHIWDHLFKTQYYGYDEYPNTGIVDPGFPLEQHGSPPGLVHCMVSQFFYPLRRLIPPPAGTNTP